MTFELEQRSGTSSSTGAPGCNVAKHFNDMSDVVAVAMRAGDDGNVPKTPEMSGVEDLIVPKAENGRGVGLFQLLDVFPALDPVA